VIGKHPPMFNWKHLKAALLAGALAAAPLVPSYAVSEDPQVHAGTKIIPARTCIDIQSLCTIRVTVNYNDAFAGSAIWFATLPKNAYILSIDADTTTAWNAATTNLLTVGATRTSANEIVADGASATANISNHTTTIATGILHLTTAAGLALAITGNSTYQTQTDGAVPLYVKYVQTGTAATAGSTTLVITYVVNNIDNG
jgi:hypothetical protein